MRFILKVLICVILAAGAGTAYLAMRSGDIFYTMHELLSPARVPLTVHSMVVGAGATTRNDRV